YDINNSVYGGTVTFTNSGTFRKSVTVGTTTLTGVAFNNTGTVDVQTGTLSMAGGLSGNGTFIGAGLVQLSGTANATVNGSMNWSGGSISGGSLSLNGTINWSGGSI